MTKWLWLIIILALISMIQWHNSKAQHIRNNNLNRQAYLWSLRNYYSRPKRASLSNQENINPITTTSRDTDDEKIESRSTNIKNTNTRILSTNPTKSLPNSGYLTDNSGDDFESPQTKSSIVFPNSVDGRIQMASNKFIPDQNTIKRCSKDDSYCIKVDNYPRQDLQHIFRTSKFISSNFFDTDLENDLEIRLSNTNLEPMCEVAEETIFPEAVKNTNNEWRFIVQNLNNDNNIYKQGITIEKCVNAGNTCMFQENLPMGYNITCVQKYMYKRLVAIKDSKDVYYLDSFKFPSCCACMYSVNTQILTRIGGGTPDQKFTPIKAETNKN